ncbi:MAG: hypothetical protein ABI823_15185, partial [Bryobacteraceae bacterium]
MKITMGADPKRTAVLGFLVVVLVGVVWYNSGPSIPDGVATSSAARPSGSKASPVPIPPRAAPGTVDANRPQTRAQQARLSNAGRGSLEEFHPSLKPKRGEEAVDFTTVDPTLKIERLARLQKVSAEGAMRSLFDFGAAPLPKVDPIKPGPRTTVAFVGPQIPAPPAPATPASKPPP